MYMLSLRNPHHELHNSFECYLSPFIHVNCRVGVIILRVLIFFSVDSINKHIIESFWWTIVFFMLIN